MNILFISSLDINKEKIGGSDQFARLLIKALAPTFNIYLVGYSRNEEKSRDWMHDYYLFNNKISFFNLGPDLYNTLVVRHKWLRKLIPGRLFTYLSIRNNIHYIKSNNSYDWVFVQSPEIIIAMNGHIWPRVCYRFAGVNNPVVNSRFKLFRLFSKIVDKHLWNAIENNNVQQILLSAGEDSIKENINPIYFEKHKSKIRQFPTRVDTSLFRLVNNNLRKELDIDNNAHIIIQVGRIEPIKNWKLMVDAFNEYLKLNTNSWLIFVGDGSEYQNLVDYADNIGILNKIIITGFLKKPKVAEYLNIASVYCTTSKKEGWSLAMLEALACGLPIVSSPVSGAKEMIIEGQNGFIVTQTNSYKYAMMIKEAIGLGENILTSRKIAKKYSMNNLLPEFEDIFSR